MDGSRPSGNRQISQYVLKLKRLLTRFSKTELLTEVPNVCKLDIRPPEVSSLDKDQVVEGLANLIKEKYKNLDDIIPLLQLKYIQNHASSRMWSALKVENAINLVTEDVEYENFAESLETFLNRSHFFCKVACRFWQEALWTIIIFNQPRGLMHDLYLIHCTDSPLVMYCAVRVPHKDVLFRALLQTYKGTAIVHYPVKARDIHSLLRLCIQKSMKQFNPSAFPSVVQKQLRKRKDDETEALPLNVIDEDSRDFSRRKKYLRDKFNNYELPRLESLSYMTKTDFYGTPSDEEVIENSHCSVVFKGQNVLEGFRKMIIMREAACPVPEYLSKVPSSGCNAFLVTNKKQKT